MRNFLYDVYYRDAHFVIGEEDEKKSEEDDKIVSDPKYVTLLNYTHCHPGPLL